jgi:hypothetical protein
MHVYIIRWTTGHAHSIAMGYDLYNFCRGIQGDATLQALGSAVTEVYSYQTCRLHVWYLCKQSRPEGEAIFG